jgi:hypothetical protein
MPSTTRNRVSDRLGLARALIEAYVPLIAERGAHTAATATVPAFSDYQVGEVEMRLTTDVLLRLNDEATSSLLDVWEADFKRLFSVSWMPLCPWIPPDVTVCRAGPWLEVLGLERFLR